MLSNIVCYSPQMGSNDYFKVDHRTLNPFPESSFQTFIVFDGLKAGVQWKFVDDKLLSPLLKYHKVLPTTAGKAQLANQ